MRRREEMLIYAERVMSKKKKSWCFNLRNLPVICLANSVTVDLETFRLTLMTMPDNMAFVIGRKYKDESFAKDYPIPDHLDLVSKIHCFVIHVPNSEYYQLFDVSKNGTEMISERNRCYKGYGRSLKRLHKLIF